MRVKIEVIHFRETAGQVWRRWEELFAQSTPPMDSPFYRPEFARLIDQVRGDVEVAIVEDEGQIVALLPFHRHGKLGLPVGMYLNDFQGFIGQLPEHLRAQDVIRGAGLKAWDFDHVPVAQGGFQSACALVDASPFIDLSSGYEAYAEFRRATSREFRDLDRRLRKLEREHGEVRFERDVNDLSVLSQLIDWKRQQYSRTSVPDVLAHGWVCETMTLLAQAKEPMFSGVLTSLRAGGRLVAADLSPRTAHVYHGQWFAFDRDFKQYSPGRLLHQSEFRWLAAEGIQRIEFGKGDQEYKGKAQTGHHLVATGSVAASRLARITRGAWWTMRRWARGSRLRPHLKAAAQYCYRLRQAAQPPVGREA